MSILTRRSECALQLSSREAIVMLPQQGGRPAWDTAVEMPPGAVTPSLHGRNLDAELVGASLRQVAGLLPRRIRGITLVLPDVCVKLLVVPIEADAALSRHMRSEIVRWALRDALPFPLDEAHIADQLFQPPGSSRCLLVAAAHHEVLREYEDAAAALGPVIRTLPATLAFGWAVADEGAPQLLAYADEDAMGCLVSSAGAPVFARTRSRRQAGGDIAAAVAETIDYVASRLGTGPGSAAFGGLAADDHQLEATLAERGWSLAAGSPERVEAARLAALNGALRAAEAGS